MAATKTKGDAPSDTSSSRVRTAPSVITAAKRTKRTKLPTEIPPKAVSTSTIMSASATAAVTNQAHDVTTGIQWSTMDIETLHTYRHAYKLNTPPAFSDPYSQLILSRPGIGRSSPTMARKGDQRRQSKEQLATVVRKHFNGLGVQENDALVEFLYKVNNQDNAFRMRFTPQRPR